MERGLVIKFPTLAARQLMEEGKKYCPGCKQVKSIKDDFSTMNVRSGIASHCKECVSRTARERNSTEEGKEKLQKYYKRNKEKQLNSTLLKDFGITLEQYNQQLAEQNGVCIICGKTPEQNKKRLAVDHNHVTGKNRGLLCASCNICIGFIEKNNLDVHNIIGYFDRYKETTEMNQC